MVVTVGKPLKHYLVTALRLQILLFYVDVTGVVLSCAGPLQGGRVFIPSLKKTMTAA